MGVFKDTKGASPALQSVQSAVFVIPVSLLGLLSPQQAVMGGPTPPQDGREMQGIFLPLGRNTRTLAPGRVEVGVRLCGSRGTEAL